MRKPHPRTPPEVRFWRFVQKTETCWLWTGATNGRYGRFGPGGRNPGVYAHRWSYEHHVGPIPEGLQIDHLCKNVLCVRPDHLEPVTAYVNCQRGKGSAPLCKRGHPMDGVMQSAITVSGTTRYCKTCRREAMRLRREGLPDADPCPTDGCAGKVHARGLCASCYARWYVTRPGDPCSVESCERTRTSRGFCRLHYERFMKHGNPLVQRTPRKAPAAV